MKEKSVHFYLADTVEFSLAVTSRTYRSRCRPETLEGSEKEVAWARTIRAKFIRKLEPLMAAHGHKLGEIELETIKSLRETVSASWWIDQRNNSLQTILAALAKKIKAEKGA